MSVEYDYDNGSIIISDQYNLGSTGSAIDAPLVFNEIDDEHILSFTNLQKVKKFTEFDYESLGITDTRYLTNYYRISRNNSSWTEWYELKSDIIDFPPFDPLDKMYIDVKFVRSGTKEDGKIYLLSYELTGELLRDVSDNDESVTIGDGRNVIIKPPFVFKVFKIEDIEIISPHSLDNVNIKYRFSQDNSRTWTNWEPFTMENISTVRINPIRFFQIEYLVENNGTTDVKIQDINLIGDFQNVTLDYHKTNLYGIRECCQTNKGYYDENGNFHPSGLTDNCSTDDIFKPLTAEEKSKLYNPYQQNKAIDLLNKLSNDSTEIFGHRVQYLVTDPDAKGIDYTLHEYGLFNIVCHDEIKVTVENNNFPDNQIIMNQFDLNLFESFEIQITKEQFKQSFGVQRRPSKEDLIYFCDIGRLFIVEHAQQFRNFNNSSVYYKVILKKYNKSANVIAGSKTIEDKIKQLTKNSTIDELFGIENELDKNSISNKPQLQTLTKDPVRLSWDVDIVKELLQNSSTIVSKSYYQLSTATYSKPAINYKNLISDIKVSDNLSLCLWFNINNYTTNDVYNLFEYYDSGANLGFSSNLSGDRIDIKLNTYTYSFDLNDTIGTSDALNEETWYSYVLNIDQRNRKLNQYIYKRNTDDEDRAVYLSSTQLELVYSDEQTITPVEFDINGINGIIRGSDMKITNIRLFSDIIPKDQHNIILNQYIVSDDSKYLIFADNANAKIVLPNYPFNP